MSHRVPITIRLESFEGPLDLLLYLIQSHELDISRVSISKITNQYLAYVRLMQELNFDFASDFLVMAATLIQWKSKSLLPQEIDPNALLNPDDDILTPEELLRQLQEHQRFLAAGADLATLPLLGDDVFIRPNRRAPIEKIWKTMDVTSLALTFQDLLVRERKRTTILKKETVSLTDKISDFRDRMEVGKLTGLRALLRDQNSRPETVVTFLASLELGRLKKMKLFQERTYDEIYVELLESLKDFDSKLASGFDSIQEAVDQGVAESEANRAARAALDRELADEQARGAASTEQARGTASTDSADLTSHSDSGTAGADGIPAVDSSESETGSADASLSSERNFDLSAFGEDQASDSGIAASRTLLSGLKDGSGEFTGSAADGSGNSDGSGHGNGDEPLLAHSDRGESGTDHGENYSG